MTNVVIIDELIGRTFANVTSENDEVHFVLDGGKYFRFYHEQDCCESVYIESIEGDLSDLEGSPILMAEEVSESGADEGSWESYTWTFYKFATIKGTVVVRFYGSSNGYYSESVYYGWEEAQ